MIDAIPSTPAAAAAANDNAARLRSAAQAFEAVFLRQMIGSMRTASPGDGLLDSGATEQFRDMSDARLADDMAAKGGFGIAALLLRQLGPATPTPTPTAETTGKPAR